MSNDHIDALKYPTAAMVHINARISNHDHRFEEAKKLGKKVRLLEAKARVLDTRNAMSASECKCEYGKKCAPCKTYDEARAELLTLESE